jgi:ribonuclease HI
MKKVSIVTDGSCLNNPGQGGWACLLRFGGVKPKEIFGFDPHTTNQRMELMAPIQGLLALKELALKEPCEVEITADSKYVVLGMTKWIFKWKRRHWWRKHGPLSNAYLWIELDELATLHKPTWDGPGATPVTKTTNGAIGWQRKRQPLSKVLGRMEGHTHLSASAWVWVTCRPNPKPVFSMTQSPLQRITRTMRKRSNGSVDTANRQFPQIG